MKKILSILLAVLMLLSTMTVLTVLPALATTPENGPVNLIVNGDGSMGQWNEHTDENGEPYTTIIDPEDPNYGFIVDTNAYGWRSANVDTANLNTPYRNAVLKWYTYDVLDSDSMPVIMVNQWNQSMQDFKIEADKTYVVTADIGVEPSTKAYSGSFDVQVDGGAGVFINQLDSSTKFVAKTGGKYDLYDDNTSHPLYNSIHFNSSVEGFPTITYNNATYYNYGPLKTYSFTFKANDVISGEKLTDDDNDGYYDVRLLFANNSSAIILFDNVSVYECYSVEAEEGGYVNTNSAIAGATTTLVATPYYGNGFAGWYNGNELVSTSTTYTGVVTSDLTAKFVIYNHFVDGSFESGTTAGIAQFTTPTRYSKVAINPTIEKTTNTAANSTLGENCIEINPASNAASHPHLLNLPVTIEKNKQYIFDYYFYYVDPTVDNPTYTAYFTPRVGSLDWLKSSCNLFKSFTYTYSIEEAVTNTNGHAWYCTVDATTGSLNVNPNAVSHSNRWLHGRMIFESGENAELFGTADSVTLNLQLGIQNGANYDIRLDNIFFGEASSDVNITAATGGTVSNTLKPAFYKSTTKGNYLASSDLETEYYPLMATEHTAKANDSYRFIGWYDTDDNLVSTNKTELFYTGDTYTAKFVEVPSHTITATAEKNADGIYGGYVIKPSQVINEEDDVTVNAVTYAGNTFEGWYNGETKVSSDESFTFTVASDVDLVAKWNVKNIWPDSGYENTEIGLEQMSLYNTNGMWHSSGTPVVWSAAKATNAKKYTGNVSIAVAHRNNEFGTKIKVEPNTDYELSFNWLLENSLLNNTSTDISYLKEVLIRGWDSSQICYTDVTTNYSADFQNTKVIFNSGDNSEIFICFNYFAASKSIFFDDVCLVPFDKETGTTDYFRVTYDFGTEKMENAAEYVKSGEYALRKHTFFFREPAMKDFVNYTVNGEDKVAGDVITVNSDVTIKMNYKDHIRSDLNNSTTFDPDNYVFTLAALPDPQKLLVHHPDYYGMIGEWLVANQEEFKIAGLMTLGDLTEYGGWSQYEAAYANLKDVMKAMPVGISLGNHDYPGGNAKGDWSANYASKEYNTTIFNHFFKDAMVEALLENNGGAYPYVNKAVEGYEVMSKDAKIDAVDNTYNIYNDEYIVISMEIFPRTEILDWANAIAKANPDKKIIVTTHSHLSDKGELLDDHDYYAIAKNETTNSAAFVREYLLEANSNIVMMVCGHDSRSEIIYTEMTREDGSIYYEVLIDNQDDDENYQGVGIVALLGFRADGTVDTTYYSTVWNKYFISDKNEVAFDFGITSHEDVAENVEEGATIDTSVIDTERYFIPYGSVYYKDGDEYKFVEKNEDGTFTAPVAGAFNFKAFRLPGAEGVATFGASPEIDPEFEGKGTVQYGSYIPSFDAAKTYGTMFVTGNWDKFVEYYEAKGWTIDDLVAKVSEIYDANIGDFDNVAITAGEEVVYVYKKDQKNHMFKNNTVLEYTLRVRNLPVDSTCTAIGYTKAADGTCTYSKNIISANYNALMGN